MRIKKYICIDTEVEVEVNVSDFLASLPTLSETVITALNGLNLIGGFLRGVSDPVVLSMKREQRAVIREFLLTQAKRYEEKTAELEEG